MRPMTPAQALRNAIAAEAAAARFYETLASRSEDPAVRAFFENMMRVEHEHGDEIQKVGEDLGVGALPAFAQTDVDRIETVPEWKDAEALGFDEALHVAMLCEQQAALHYADLAVNFDEPVRSFFLDVAASERQHGRMIEGVLRKRISQGISTFTLEQMVRNLIEVERASARFYAGLAKRCTHPQARSFLQGMVEVEELHAAQIVALGQSMAHGPLPENASMETMRFEIPPSWPAPVDIDLNAALDLALEAERRACDYYRLLARCFSGETAAFLSEMAETEAEHARSIEDLLRRIREDDT